MKKNKMLRLASVLLVMTLLTTSIIGGTFAKYVTTESGSDTARVAKFGVVATVSGDLFGSTYTAVSATSDGNTITNYSVNGGTVSAAAKDDNTASAKVVAPGTENKTGLTLSAKGTPEVSTKVTFAQIKDSTNSDIYLKEGDYGVMVEYTGARTTENITKYYTESSGTYTPATAVPADTTTKVYELRDKASFTGDAYYPLTWYVNGTKVDDQTKVTTRLGTDFRDKAFEPNKNLNLTDTVGWAWEFQKGSTDAEKDARDKKDTILGDMISAKLTTTNPIAVVKKDSGANGTYSTVNYQEIDNNGTKIIVAYTGTTKPTALDDTAICACLTAAFGASITVEQVD